MTTWTLFLFLGFGQPLQINGYSSQELCQQAGKQFIDDRSARMTWSDLKGRDALGYCLKVD